MANPQKEDGYVGIANELFDAICAADFTSRQYAVVLAVIRRTYGFNRKKAPISVRELSLLTGITFAHVSETVSELIVMSVMIDYGVRGQTRVLGLNKNYEEWRVFPKQEQWVFPKQERYSSQNRNASVPKTGTPTIKRQRKTKERQHAPAFLTLWELFPEKKRLGLHWVSEEVEQEVVGKIDTVRKALEEYLASVEDEKYLVKAEKFFAERMWEAYAPEETENPKRGGFQ